MNESSTLSDLTKHITAKHSLHTWSLIVSHFGARVHFGEQFFSQTQLREVLSPIGVKDSAIRVALLRLVNDGWLLREKRGRERFYEFTPAALKTSQSAAKQIFLPTQPADCEYWQFALINPAQPTLSAVEQLQLGFGKLGELGLLRAVYDWREPCDARLIVSELTPLSSGLTPTLAKQIWTLDRLYTDYQWFTDLFSAFHVLDINPSYRLLLIHEYRRIVLRDPILPASILGSWPGEEARALVRSLYRS